MLAPPAASRTTRVEQIGIAALIGVAAWLRFAGLGQGLPMSPQVDEPEIVDRALTMMRSGNYNPAPFFDYPTLYIYLQLATGVIYFLYGAVSGAWGSLAATQSPEFYWGFYPWARTVTATLGTATVIITYFVARRLGVTAALAAGLLLAVIPMHVRESHFVLTDVPMTFFVTLTLWLSVRAVESGRVGGYVAAGAAGGLAAATKYNGGLAVLMALVALLCAGRGINRMRATIGIVGGASAAFLVAAPFTVLELPAFLDGFAALSTHYTAARASAEAIYFKHLLIAMGYPALGLAILGMGVAVWHAVTAPAASRATSLAVLVFAVVWFEMVSNQSLVYGRYLLPMLPTVAVLFGAGVAAVVHAAWPRLTRRTGSILVTVLAIACLATPFISSLGFVRNAMRTWTTDLARDWILTNIPAGAHMIVETRMLVLPSPRYQTSNEPNLAVGTVDAYASAKVDYLIASSQSFGPYIDGSEAGSPRGLAYRQIFSQSELVYWVVPSAKNPGPEIRVYRIPR